jgi:hypothetical protein
LLIHIRSQALTLPVVGQVRSTAYVLPLKAGTQMIGNGYPVAQSPVERGFTSAGFTASGEAGNGGSDSALGGDATPGTTGYESHYLQQGEAGVQWMTESTEQPESRNEAELFQPFRATFYKAMQEIPSHTQVP